MLTKQLLITCPPPSKITSNICNKQKKTLKSLPYALKPLSDMHSTMLLALYLVQAMCLGYHVTLRNNSIDTTFETESYSVDQESIG